MTTSDPKGNSTLFFKDLLAEVSHLPDVLAAGATMSPPGRVDSSGGYWIDHLPTHRDPTGPTAVLSIISPGTFEALGIPLVRGRDFTNGDAFDAPWWRSSTKCW